MLAEFSRILGSNLREYDTLARYGGEEFVVILPETSVEDACVVAEKIAQRGGIGSPARRFAGVSRHREFWCFPVPGRKTWARSVKLS